MLPRRKRTEMMRSRAQSGNAPKAGPLISTSAQARSQPPLPAKTAKAKGAPKEVINSQYLFQRSSATMGQVMSRSSVNGYSNT